MMMRIKASSYFPRVEDISPHYLAAKSIEGVILDIDNTIVIDGRHEVEQSVVDWVSTLCVPVCLLSNGGEERVMYFMRLLGLKGVYRAKKPARRGYLKAATLLGVADLTHVAVVGDQLFSDILGGNRLGCHTIKVDPIDVNADPIAVKARRWLERFIS